MVFLGRKVETALGVEGFAILVVATNLACGIATSIALFVLFMFIVVIVMLNVLIAIVSDSYDCAMTRGERYPPSRPA